ncbi:MAG: rod shape-determining protein MreC [bacterium]|nr:rod shape-determining protein MreC [bacterium]
MAKEKKKRPIIAFVVLFMAVIYVFSRGWLAPFQGAFLRLISPITAPSASATQTVGAYFLSFLRVGTLSRTVRILENTIVEDQVLLAKYSGIDAENKVLREQLRLLPKNKFQLVSADVIAHSTDGGKDVLIINRGNRDGIKENMPVIMNDGVVVGKIARADNLVATVMLMTDVDFKLAAIVVGTKAPGLIHGTKGLDVSLEEVPRAEKIKIGESVVTTGVDGVFPPDLLVGKIRSVDAPENEIFQSAKVTPVIDIRQARIVSVIRAW